MLTGIENISSYRANIYTYDRFDALDIEDICNIQQFGNSEGKFCPGIDFSEIFSYLINKNREITVNQFSQKDLVVGKIL